MIEANYFYESDLAVLAVLSRAVGVGAAGVAAAGPIICSVWLVVQRHSQTYQTNRALFDKSTKIGTHID